jgi:hypothetical protein
MSGGSDEVRVYLMPDTMDGNAGWWIACADFAGSPAYDASGRTPEEACARLAQDLAEALRVATR